MKRGLTSCTPPHSDQNYHYLSKKYRRVWPFWSNHLVNTSNLQPKNRNNLVFTGAVERVLLLQQSVSNNKSNDFDHIEVCSTNMYKTLKNLVTWNDSSELPIWEYIALVTSMFLLVSRALISILIKILITFWSASVSVVRLVGVSNYIWLRRILYIMINS